jgi:serine/threonine protein kinase
MMTMCDYSYEIDLWGLGITIYTLLVGRMPFKEVNINKSVKKVMNCEVNFPRYDRIPITRIAKDLIK